MSRSRLFVGVGITALLTASGSAAIAQQIDRVQESDFHAGAGLITFSEFPLGTQNPVYTPSIYGGDANSPTVYFGGLFNGQELSPNPNADCPGAAATACVVGTPTAGLSLDPNSPKTFITGDGAQPTAPILSGSPTYNGPIAILFSKDQVGVGFDGGYFDAAHSTGITAFARDGTLLGTVVNNGTGIEFLGLVSATGQAIIAGVFLDLVGAEPAGFDIDNVRFGVAGQVTIPGGGGGGTQYTYWDGDGAGHSANGVVDGGSGVWSATRTNWTIADGTQNGAYSPNPTLGVFQGAPGTVTVDDSAGQISITGLQFNVSGYTIVGDPINLAGPSAMISVGNLTAATAGYVEEIDANLVGSGGLDKLGLGTLILGGANTYTGVTTVSVGSLLVNGTQANSAVNVESGALLGGYGTTGSVTALTGSTIAPGGAGAAAVVTTGPGNQDLARALATATANGIGTLTVSGTFNQAAGSTYALKLTGAGANDMINVTGTATVTPGATLALNKLDATPYILGHRYTVLTAAGGFTGAYTLSGNTHVSLFYSLVADYDANDVYIDVAETTPFAAVGTTPNQIAAAAGADSAPGALHDAIGYLQTAPEAQAAFDSISGEIHATVRAMTFEDSRFVREAVYAHFDEYGGTKPIWFHAFASHGHQNGDGNAASSHRDIGGFVVGADAINTGNLHIGVMAGYGHSTLALPDRTSTATADDGYVGAYAGIEARNFSLRAGGSYTFRTVKTSRTVSFTGFNDALAADYSMFVAQVFGEVGYKIPLGALTVEPYGSAAVVSVDNNAAQEGGGAAKLFIHAKRTDVTFTNLGGRIMIGKGPIKLFGDGSWRSASRSIDDVSVPLSFAGGNTFSIAAPLIAKNVAAYSAGAGVEIGTKASLLVGYSGESGDGLVDNGVKATFRLRF
jgi:outer membrane autotransporter protein